MERVNNTSYQAQHTSKKDKKEAKRQEHLLANDPGHQGKGGKKGNGKGQAGGKENVNGGNTGSTNSPVDGKKDEE